MSESTTNSLDSLSPASKLWCSKNFVKTVNNVGPDTNGNVNVIGTGNGVIEIVPCAACIEQHDNSDALNLSEANCVVNNEDESTGCIDLNNFITPGIYTFNYNQWIESYNHLKNCPVGGISFVLIVEANQYDSYSSGNSTIYTDETIITQTLEAMTLSPGSNTSSGVKYTYTRNSYNDAQGNRYWKAWSTRFGISGLEGGSVNLNGELRHMFLTTVNGVSTSADLGSRHSINIPIGVESVVGLEQPEITAKDIFDAISGMVSTAISNAITAALPIGSIIMWRGSKNSIPAGWQILNVDGRYPVAATGDSALGLIAAGLPSPPAITTNVTTTTTGGSGSLVVGMPTKESAIGAFEATPSSNNNSLAFDSGDNPWNAYKVVYTPPSTTVNATSTYDIEEDPIYGKATTVRPPSFGVYFIQRVS